ncbi:MAG: phosphodiesterase [Sphaerochaetaceae bacterium]
MKLLFASDIHGSAYYTRLLVDIFAQSKAVKLVLLGDILYHGPRNDLPREYNPKLVIEMLNPLAKKIICIRGNCDAEVDQMVLAFPVLSDSAFLFLSELDGATIYLTHGHVLNEVNPPPMAKGDILISGHTHIPVAKQGEYVFLNPGSVSIPKGGSIPSYMEYEDRRFVIKGLDGTIVKTLTIEKRKS